jgi:di/tricarboxylate transporter
MTERLKSDREHMLLFSFIWIAASLWGARYYPLVKDFDFSKLSAPQLNLLLLISLASIFGLIMTAVYVYKVAASLKLGRLSARMVTSIFVVSALLLGLFSFVIVALLVWKSNKPIIDDKNNN